MKQLFSGSYLILILVGTIIWSLTMVKSGLIYDYGMGFWGPNGHDGIWHIAIINSLAKGTMEMPIFAGEFLKNYHIGFDLILAIIHRITNIPVINLYFQVTPPILSFLIGLFVYKFVLLWKNSKTQAFWATFFVYFSGSFGWLVTLARSGEVGGESLFWAQQSISTLVNPPFALSLVFIFLGLICLATYFKTHKFIDFIFASLLFSLLIQIKVYAGILALTALLFAGLWNIFVKRGYQIIFMFLVTAIFSFIILMPTYDLRTKSLILQPFWFLESMVATPDRLYWPKMASALSNYKLSGNVLKGATAYLLTFTIFFVGNLGIRIISIPWIIKKMKIVKEIDVFELMILLMALLGIFIPTFFIQSGNSWNSIQFFYYSLVLLSLLSGISLGEYVESSTLSKKIRGIQIFLIFTIIFIFTVPTLVSTLRHYLPARPPAKISTDELSALEFLKKQPDGVVLTQPFNKDLADKAVSSPPRPLYLYESTAYVSALADKRTYIDDEVNLEITNFKWKERLNEVVKNFNNITYLTEHNISYVYIPNNEGFQYKDYFAPYIIYDSSNIAIYKLP